MSLLTPPHSPHGSPVAPSVPRSDTAPPAAGDAIPLYRMSAATYRAITASGALGPDDHVELLEGLLVQRTSKNPPHEATIRKLRMKLAQLLPSHLLLDVQAPIDLGDSLPEPDLSIVRADPGDYADRHPAAGDTLLVIEVADTTLKTDLGIKLRTYARAGIPQYWVVNLLDRRIEVYSQPDPAATPPTYNLRQPLGPEATVTLVLPDTTAATIAVTDLLP